MRSRAAVLVKFGAPLEIHEVEVADPGPDEVRVRILAAGVCGSDSKAQAGRNALYQEAPVVLGHESVGVVESVGAGVVSVAPGDHVLISMNRACGRCPECAAGRAYLCTDTSRRLAVSGRMGDGRAPFRLAGREVPAFIGIGSFAEHVLVGASMLVPVPAGHYEDALALLTCAVVTGVGAVRHVAGVRPGETVLVVGCGGVGLNVVQGAVLAGASRIIAVDTNAAKLESARQMGATDVLMPDGAMAEQVLALEPGGVCHAFDATGADGMVAAAMASTRPGGTTVLVGSPAARTVDVPPGLLFGGRVLRGCVGGNAVPAVDLPLLIRLLHAGRLRLEPLISERIQLEQVNDAIERQRAGEVARSLIVFDRHSAPPDNRITHEVPSTSP
ncbi:alcohol dehydrogenase catalytic domain-containing protein [Streptomyces spiralis]|uniref:alcohol dehydrogenase catalytic domain-containing protein n=1 Tax=Streptomyces spiralis TaxID=66376 RepID=UPI00340DEE99